MSEFDEACGFCRDARNQTSSRNVVVRRDEHNFVFADISPITNFHFLVATNDHVTSFAKASSRALDEASLIIWSAANELAAQGKTLVVAEHGTGRANTLSNACIEHAHLHLVGIEDTAQLERLVQIYTEKGGQPRVHNYTGNLDELAHYAADSYNFILSEESGLLVWDELTGFWPQFFRGAMCDALGFETNDNRRTWQLSMNFELAFENALATDAFGDQAKEAWKAHTFVNKLVRDRIPEVIAAKGGRTMTYELPAEDRQKHLLAKLYEEVDELSNSVSIDEAADVFEVLRSLSEENGWSIDDVTSVANQKRARLGAFEKGLFLRVKSKEA